MLNNYLSTRMLKSFLIRKKFLLIISTAILFFVSIFYGCQKTDYDNPHDSSVNTSLWAPQSLTTDQTSLKTVELKWAQPDQRIDSFCIESRRNNGAWKVLGYNDKSQTSFIDSTYIPDAKTPIDYRITAIAFTNKSFSQIKTITPVFGKPYIPAATKEPGVKIKVVWYDTYSNEDGYKLEKKINGGSWMLCADTLRANSTFYYDMNPELNAVITYRISVRAVGVYSDTTSAMPLSTIIAQPTWFTIASLSQTSCRIDWKQGEDWTTGYKVDRQVGNNPWQDSWLKLDAATTTFTDINLPADQDIKYRVSTIVNNSFSLPKDLIYGLAQLDSITTFSPDYSTVKVKSRVLNENGNNVTEWGIVYSNSLNPTTADNKIIANTTGNTEFSTTITGLDNTKTYYIRSYAINRRGESYGPQKTFTPNPFLLPQLSNPVVDLIYYYWITVSGVIRDQGGAQISEAGFVLSTSPGPTINDIKVVSSTNFPLTNSTYNLYSQVNNLSVGQTYYIRSYAKNIVGVAYSTEKNFTTWNYVLPISNPTTVMMIDANRIQVSSAVGDMGGDKNVKYGFVYGKNPNPTLADNVWNDTKVTYIGLGIMYNSLITNLTPNQVYHIRSYAQNAAGVAYGPDQTVSTTKIMEPSPDVTTLYSSGYTTATVKSRLFGDGGSPVTEAGFVYSTSSVPTIADNKAVSIFNASDYTFSSDLSSLQDNTVYYCRSYAINSTGIGYGLVTSFKTYLISPPQVDKTTVNNVYPTIIYVTSRVINNGGSLLSENGFVYGDNPGPTIADNKIMVNSGLYIDYYTTGLANLLPDHQYYIRSYVKNLKGVAYSPDVAVTTKSLSLPLFNPLVVDTYVSNSVFFNCQIISDGGKSLTESGYVYSTHPGSTISDNKLVTAGIPMNYGAFNMPYHITSLTVGQTYYVRCFATTSLGTSYSEEKSFTPLP